MDVWSEVAVWRVPGVEVSGLRGPGPALQVSALHLGVPSVSPYLGYHGFAVVVSRIPISPFALGWGPMPRESSQGATLLTLVARLAG